MGKEVAALLNRGAKAVYAMATIGENPAFKVSGQRRVERAQLNPWIDARLRDNGGGHGE